MKDKPAPSRSETRKRYYRVREASAITGVPAYVLRFWESQFSGLRPKRTASGHRLYREADLALIQEIKNLLYERHFTIAGARLHLAAGENPTLPDAEPQILAELYQELKHLRRLLDDPP